MRQPDFVTALVTTALSVVMGLLVANVIRGDREQVMNGAVIVIVISFALTTLWSQRDR